MTLETPFRRLVSRCALVAVAAGLALTPPALAQQVPQSREQITLSYAPLVKRAAPAVVNIYSRRVIKQRVSPFMEDPFFRQFFGDAFRGVPRERVESSLGSGVIIRPDGLIVTNDHVIKDADQITVVLADRREFPAKVMSADEKVDLAVLRIDTKGEKLPTLDLGDSDSIQVGDLVLAIGNPFGVGQTVTSGIVSALARTGVGVSDFNFFIQTDAAINPGNSGGALITMDGKLAGINSAIYSRSGGSVGIGFAIPADMVRSVVTAVEGGGKLVRPWMGASGQPVTQELATNLGLPRPQGVLINQLNPKGPLEQAGVKVGDVVTSVNGHLVDDPESLRYRIALLPVGGNATLTIIRKGAETKLPVKLIGPPEDPPRDETALDGRQPFAGTTVANINPALAEEVGYAGSSDGVIVLKVQPGTTAQALGFQPGDVVVKVNGQPITRVADLKRLVNQPQRRWDLAVRRGDQVLTLSVGG
ncbi:DegQ family serine endoprotease [Nitrospirillum amazonense]|uniref:DegQ family serine endoprotease n=1 Tax=Nitrospirillum amazonense TaxID=28077 RepID=UPI002412DFB6|nr:DegQ family serine endoprotease [Nitrospirillum amazonense]MDG3441897.1 DegQ family serine endoprotease [Nitrospirillum amazonense]